MLTKEDYIKLSKERLAELLVEKDKLIDQLKVSVPNYPSNFPVIIQEARPACYEPGGICTNPFHDCVNCPRAGSTGGYWSLNTSIVTHQSDTSKETNVADAKNGNYEVASSTK